MPERDDLALILEAAKGAGEIAKRYFGTSYKKWDKGKGQPVTEADIAVNHFLHDSLTAARPAYGWLSEESADNEERKTAAKTFVIDPIDGTVAFLKHKPHFSISIAVVEQGRPSCAVVLNPITGECFSAQAGRGAMLNGAPIHVSDRDEIEGCRMVGAKSLFEHTGWSKAPLSPWPPMQIEQRNSIAYRLALVGAGMFDATLALSAKNDWDLAAGDLVTHEADGRVTDHHGNVLHYNGARTIQKSIVAAGPKLHALLIARTDGIKMPGEGG